MIPALSPAVSCFSLPSSLPSEHSASPAANNASAFAPALSKYVLLPLWIKSAIVILTTRAIIIITYICISAYVYAAESTKVAIGVVSKLIISLVLLRLNQLLLFMLISQLTLFYSLFPSQRTLRFRQNLSIILF